MKKTILPILFALMVTSAFAQRFAPMTESFGEDRYRFLHDFAMEHYPDAKYIISYDKGFFIIGNDRLASLALDREYWPYYQKKYDIPNNIGRYRKELNNEDNPEDRKWLKKRIREYRKMKRKLLFVSKPKIKNEVCAGTDGRFNKAMDCLMYSVTNSAKGQQWPWLDALVYFILPASDSETAVVCKVTDPDTDTPERHFELLMSDIEAMVDEGNFSASDGLINRMNDCCTEFMQYSPKDSKE